MRLADKLVAISVLDGGDLTELGLPLDAIRRVLKAIVTPLLVNGCRLAYGGSIDHPGTNFTLVMSEEIGDTHRRIQESPKRPFVHFVTHRVFVDTPVAAVAAHLRKFARHGEIWVTGSSGILGTLSCVGQTCEQIYITRPRCRSIMANGAENLEQSGHYKKLVGSRRTAPATSLGHMRQQMARLCDARVQVGGRKTGGFTGVTPGLIEEALLTIEHGKPLFLLGGFGGTTRDIAVALGLLDPAELAGDLFPLSSPYQRSLQDVRRLRPRFESTFSIAEWSQLRTLARTRSVEKAGELVGQLVLRRLGAYA